VLRGQLLSLEGLGSTAQGSVIRRHMEHAEIGGDSLPGFWHSRNGRKAQSATLLVWKGGRKLPWHQEKSDTT
jgi:hypothetical protein